MSYFDRDDDSPDEELKRFMKKTGVKMEDDDDDDMPAAAPAVSRKRLIDDDDDDDNDQVGGSAEDGDEEGGNDENEDAGEDMGDDDDDEPSSGNLKAVPPSVAFANKTEEDEEDPDGEEYVKKFNRDVMGNYIADNHPEIIMQNDAEIKMLSKVVRDEKGNIVDPLHRTLPYLTKFERARILGAREKQINAGATAFVKVPEHIIDGYQIALLELEAKRIPLIIRRPIPGGGFEYWNIQDLEML